MGGSYKGKQFFITWPRTDTNKSQLTDFIVTNWHPYEIYTSQEQHKEEIKVVKSQNHLHCCFRFLNNKDGVTKERILKELEQEYGKYEKNRIQVQGAREWKDVMKYVTKCDSSYIHIIDDETAKHDIIENKQETTWIPPDYRVGWVQQSVEDVYQGLTESDKVPFIQWYHRFYYQDDQTEVDEMHRLALLGKSHSHYIRQKFEDFCQNESFTLF